MSINRTNKVGINFKQSPEYGKLKSQKSQNSEIENLLNDLGDLSKADLEEEEEFGTLNDKIHGVKENPETTIQQNTKKPEDKGVIKEEKKRSERFNKKLLKKILATNNQITNATLDGSSPSQIQIMVDQARLEIEEYTEQLVDQFNHRFGKERDATRSTTTGLPKMERTILTGGLKDVIGVPWANGASETIDSSMISPIAIYFTGLTDAKTGLPLPIGPGSGTIFVTSKTEYSIVPNVGSSITNVSNATMNTAMVSISAADVRTTTPTSGTLSRGMSGNLIDIPGFSPGSQASLALAPVASASNNAIVHNFGTLPSGASFQINTSLSGKVFVPFSLKSGIFDEI